MDTNQILSDLRAFASGEQAFDIDDVVQAFDALDKHLCRGGEMPDAWQVGQKRAAQAMGTLDEVVRATDPLAGWVSCERGIICPDCVDEGETRGVETATLITAAEYPDGVTCECCGRVESPHEFSDPSDHDPVTGVQYGDLG